MFFRQFPKNFDNQLEKLIFYTIFFPFLLLVTLSLISKKIIFPYILYNENLSNFLSLVFASICWFLFYKKLKNFFGTKLSQIVTCLFFIKIFFNYIFIYTYQLPLYELDSSSGLDNNYGDVGLINLSILRLIYENSDIFLRFISEINYFNNKGSIIFYSLIYDSFGAFPTNVIPWDSFALAATSLIFGYISTIINKSSNNIFSVIIIFILPSFFLSPLLYRDIYIVLFISISILIIFYNEEKSISLKKLFYLIFFSFILFFFRKFYFAIPIVFYLLFLIFSNKFNFKIIFIFIFISFLILFFIFLYKKLIFVDSATSGILGSNNLIIDTLRDLQLRLIHGERYGGQIVNFIENKNFLYKIIFRTFAFLITPFPWLNFNQGFYSVYYHVLSFHVFISIMIYTQIIIQILKNELTLYSKIMISFFIIICLYASFGALQFTHYYIIAGPPILITILNNISLKNIKKIFFISFIFSVLLHISHYLIKNIIL